MSTVERRNLITPAGNLDELGRSEPRLATTIDAKGRLRHRQFGEGGYERSELVIQQLLREAGLGGIDEPLVPVEAGGIEADADWASLQSPENYVGGERTRNFTSLHNGRFYAAPTRLRLNHWALTGDWMLGKQAVILNAAHGRIAYRFHARDLHLVMSPARGSSVRFRVFLDGQPPGSAHGIDVDNSGSGTLTEARLY